MFAKDCIKEKITLWKSGQISQEDFLCWLIDCLIEEIDKKEDVSKATPSVKVASETDETKIEEDEVKTD